MTQNELLQLLSSAGLHPITVEGGIEREDVRGMLFLGDTLGFIETAKVLGSRCVFLTSKVLQEADFSYEDDSRRFFSPGDSEDTGPVDLTALEPALLEYKKHVGQHCGFRMWVPAQNTTLEFVFPLPWWEPFSELRERTIVEQDRNRELLWAKQGEERQRKEEALLQRLGALIDDPEFVRLPSQLAKKEYAVEHIPGLEELGPKRLLAEIRVLDAKIKAKGLGRKK
jgi:hypothetical protein